MTTLLPIILSTVAISFGALAGIVTLILNRQRLQKILLSLVSLSAGTLMGGAFLHLLPEAVETAEEPHFVFLVTLASFVVFFLLERILHWHHCHDVNHTGHLEGHMNLIGDAVHNFLDGLIIAAAYSVDLSLGIATTVAVALHEIPQEISDFGVLLHAGWEVRRALVINFLVAFTIVVGGITGFLLSDQVEGISQFLMPVAAGGFLYIAASDLMPELRKEQRLSRSLLHMTIFIAGILLMWLLAHSE